MEQNDQNKFEILKIVYDHYKNDFSLYWTRSNFFLLIQVGLISYFGSNHITIKDDEIKYRLLISIVGLIIAIIWFLVILSSTKWIDVWRKKLLEIDSDVNPYQSFSKGEKSNSRQWKPFHEIFRPEILSNIMALAFIILWITLLSILIWK